MLPNQQRLLLVLVGDHLPHDLEYRYLFFADPALDHPQIRIPHFREQGLLRDFIAHFLAPLTKPKKHINTLYQYKIRNLSVVRFERINI